MNPSFSSLEIEVAIARGAIECWVHVTDQPSMYAGDSNEIGGHFVTAGGRDRVTLCGRVVEAEHECWKEFRPGERPLCGLCCHEWEVSESPRI